MKYKNMGCNLFWFCSKPFLTDYDKCSKILNTGHLPKRPRQTVQIHIRLLLKKQSEQGLPACYSDKHFVNSSPDNQHFIWEQEKKRKSFTCIEWYMTWENLLFFNKDADQPVQPCSLISLCYSLYFALSKVSIVSRHGSYADWFEIY